MMSPQSFGSSRPSLMKRILSNKILIVIVLAALLLFYWKEVRPMYKYRACAAQSSTDAKALLQSKAVLARGTKSEKTYAQMAAKNMYLRSDYESFLKKCLLYYGLPSEALQVSKNDLPADGTGTTATK